MMCNIRQPATDFRQSIKISNKRDAVLWKSIEFVTRALHIIIESYYYIIKHALFVYCIFACKSVVVLPATFKASKIQMFKPSIFL